MWAAIGYEHAMVTRADDGLDNGDAAFRDPSPVAAMVNMVAGLGLTICLVALLLSSSSFSIERVLLALLLAVPFLLYARLALVRPGVDAVIAGVLLVAIGTWGSIVAMGDGSTTDFVQLALSLVAVQLAVFGFGALLRMATPESRR
jgi:hypothetical protein